MAKTFACREAGVTSCGAQVRGQSDDEVIAKAVEHARNAHGVDLTQSRTLMRHVRQSIRDDARARAGGER